MLSILKTYFSPSGSDSASAMRDAVRWAAAGVTVGYGVALLYRSGAMAYMIPSPVYKSLVNNVEKIKSKTMPMVDKERYALAVKHFIRTYSLVTYGLALSAVGTMTFFKFPDIPIGVTMAGTVTPAMVLLFGSNWMSRTGSLVCYSLMCFSCGVSFGPMNWVAYDSLLPLVLIAGSTAVGFCVPLVLTRGAVSYFCSAQLLSCSLSVVGAGLTIAASQVGARRQSTRIEDDVNVMLTVQIMCNAALGLLHTLPTLYRFLSSSTPIEQLEQENPVLQASLIYGAAAYGTFAFLRRICRTVLRRLRKDSGALTREESSAIASLDAKGIRRMSNVGASLFLVVVYARMVTQIQSHAGRSGKSTSKSLETLRRVFAKLSPLSIGVLHERR